MLAKLGELEIEQDIMGRLVLVLLKDSNIASLTKGAKCQDHQGQKPSISSIFRCY